MSLCCPHRPALPLAHALAPGPPPQTEDQQAQIQQQQQLQAASQAAAAAQSQAQGEDGPKSLEDLMAEAKVGEDGEECVSVAIGFLSTL